MFRMSKEVNLQAKLQANKQTSEARSLARILAQGSKVKETSKLGSRQESLCELVSKESFMKGK